MQGDNISTVEGIQYSGGRILIWAYLVINNDKKIIDILCILQYEIFIQKFFENSSRVHAFLELDCCTAGPILFQNNWQFYFWNALSLF